MCHRWYALRSKPYKEEVLWQQTLKRGYETFYPRLQVQPVNPRARRVKPYFPGYMFVRVDIEVVGISTFRWMPYSLGLVTFGGEPAYVPDSLIDVLDIRVKEINESGGETFDSLKPGDRVRIQAGPFTGYEAIFSTRTNGNERVRVLLELMSDRSVILELSADQIELTK
jgi:transcription antitermination factor NusG